MSESNQPAGEQGSPGGPYAYGQNPPAAQNPAVAQGDHFAPPTSPAPSAAPAWGSAPSGSASAGPSAAPGVAPSAAPGAAPWAAAEPGPSTASAPGAPAPAAASAGTTLRSLGLGTPVPTLVIGAAAYVVALLASIVVIVSIVLAALTSGPTSSDLTGGATGTTPSTGDTGFEGIIGLIGLPFQLVALATFGSYDAQLDLGFLGSATMSWSGLPLLITVAMVLTAFLAARSAQRRWSSNGLLGIVLWSGISGLGVALVALLLTRLTAFSITDDELGLSLMMHAAGVDMFFGTWALITLPLLLGHLSGMTKPAWWPMVEDLAAAPRLALVHALTFALPVGLIALVAGAIAAAVNGDGDTILPALLALPVWGLTGLALLPGLGMLVVPLHLIAHGDVDAFGLDRQHGFLWFFDLPWYVWVPMVLIALVVPLLVALLWHRGREIQPGSMVALVVSWAALPLAYALCSIVLLALARVQMDVEMGMLGGLGISMGPALWMPVVAFFVGLALEAISRFGAPFVDRYVPGPAVNWFRRSARARRAALAPAAPAAPADAQAPVQTPHQESSPAGPPRGPLAPGA